MNVKKQTLRVLCCLIICLIGLSCAPSEIAGGSSGTEVSAVAGSVLNGDGTPAADAVVKIRPSTFLVDSANSESYCSAHTLKNTTTDSNGKFFISPVLPDSYSIEIIVNDSLASSVQLHIPDNHTADTIPPVTVLPVAEFTGNAQIYYGTSGSIQIQPYGLDRAATIDSNGNFALKVPHGEHTYHIAAYQPDDSLHNHSFDHIDITLDMNPGEHRDAFKIQLRPAPPPACEDGVCDSIVLQKILFETGNGKTPIDAICEKDSTGRIVAINAHGFNFDRGMPFDITRLSALQHLDLSDSRMSIIFPHIGSLSRLETINLANNRLEFFSSSIGNLANLRELDLSNNNLSELPDSIVNCTNLTLLNVSENRLCSVDTMMSSWIAAFSAEWRTSQRCP